MKPAGKVIIYLISLLFILCSSVNVFAGQQAGVNLYEYVGSNSVNRIDPLGLDYIDVDKSNGGAVYWVIEHDGRLYNKDVRRVEIGHVPLGARWHGASNYIAGDVQLSAAFGGGALSLDLLNNMAGKFWERPGSAGSLTPMDISGLPEWEQNATILDFITHWRPKNVPTLSENRGILKSKNTKRLDSFQTGLDCAGMAPGVGIVPDAANAVIHAFRLNGKEFLFSLGACAPAGGQYVTASKYKNKFSQGDLDNVLNILRKYTDDIDVLRHIDDIPLSLRGPATTDVYLGIIKNSPEYAGISFDFARRARQHGGRFDVLLKLTQNKVSRMQARAIEEVLIMRAGGDFKNIRHAISPNHKYYQKAVEWGESWLKYNGFNP